MGIDLQKLKEILAFSYQFPGFTNIHFCNNGLPGSGSAFHSNICFYNTPPYSLHTLSNPSEGEFTKNTKNNSSGIKNFNVYEFKNKTQITAFNVLILKLQRYVVFLKSLFVQLSLFTVKNIFVHLSEKTNLLFRLDNNTVLSLQKALHTTTTI